nr:Para hydroxybenzoate polyprenyltransferase [Hymenolepis microstoma]
MSSRYLFALYRYCASRCVYKFSLRFSSSVAPQLPLWFNNFPKKVHPYMELARLDRPTGTWLVYLPSTWSIALAASPGCLPDFGMLALFGTGAILMRGAGCTVNDIVDSDIDSKVTRTRDRPIARGSVSTFNAILFLGLQLTGALAILLQLNSETIAIGASCVGLVCVYPLFKRFTYFPQVMLGLTMNWGALMGYTAITGFDMTICLPIYLAGAFQTMLFDSIYSFQDIKDDKRIGVKSMPILLNGTSKWWLYTMAAAMSTSLATAGLTSGAGSVYFAGTGLTMFHVFYKVWKTSLNDPENCFAYFKSNRNIGLILFAIIALDRFLLPAV